LFEWVPENGTIRRRFACFCGAPRIGRLWER